jgi:RsiW-degrading membrane proteinase PrsW (M82 family)
MQCPHRCKETNIDLGRCDYCHISFDALPQEDIPRKENEISDSGTDIFMNSKSIGDLLRSSSFKELFAITSGQVLEAAKNPIVWFVLLLAMTPLLLSSLQDAYSIFLGISIYAACLWGLLFYRLFADEKHSLLTGAGVLAFTCFVGVPLLEVYIMLPPHISDQILTQSKSFPLSLFGFIFGVGIREELCKSLPLFILLRQTGKLTRPIDGIFYGMVSGLGFAAAENVYYIYMSSKMTAMDLLHHGVLDLNTPIFTNVMRLVSLSFLHACFSGIFGYFIVIAVNSTHFRKIIFLVGLFLAASLHGLYNALVKVNILLSVLVGVFSYILLINYIVRAKKLPTAEALIRKIFSQK